MVTKSLLPLVLAASFVNGAAAQGPITTEQFDRRLELLGDAVEQLTGQAEFLEKKYRFLASKIIAGKVSEEEIRLALEVARRPNVENQRALFEKLLIQMICNYEENCETRRRLEDLDRRVDALSGREHSVLRPMIPGGVTVIPASGEEYVVHRIVNSRSKVCRNAILLAKCLNHRQADGRVYHGDLYVDCSGNQVLVTHRRTSYR